jgi:hypothetical protein
MEAEVEIDAERSAELLRWAASLSESETAELRAAGRAIRVLCEQNDALRRRIATLEDGAGWPGPPDGPSAGAGSEDERPRRAPRKSRGWGFPRRLAIAVGAVLAVCGMGLLGARAAAPSLKVTGPPSDAVLGPAALASLVFESTGEGASWTFDGKSVKPAHQGGKLVLRFKTLPDGEHTLVVRREGRLFTSSSRSFSFVIDTAAPVLRLDKPAVAAVGQPLSIAGTVEPGATLAAGRKQVPLDGDGRFTLAYRNPPTDVTLLATDAAGNGSRWRIPVTIAPRRPKEPVRAVHVTAYGWADPGLRAGVLALIREHRINAVELDLKDEAGEIGWNAPVPLARKMGANRSIFDLEAAVTQLHGMGVRVIGRLVCFRDPIHAEAAWNAGRRDEVMQAPGGEQYSGYGGFTNVASAAVREYNIAVAVAAAEAGVDEILYDYVRRPDGPISGMVFAGLRTTPEQAIVDFLAESRRALAKSGVLVGASVFGVAATRPTEVAQDIHAMARQVDYVAPMLYPSHWGPGEYDVADPNGSPYQIVRRSMVDFQRQVRGTGARVVPWLQDFSLGRTYGATEVAAQITAARDADADEFILWDPAVSYTTAALTPTARVPALGLGPPQAFDAPGPVRLADPKPIVVATAEAEAATAEAGGRPLSGLQPNELGRIPVLMHHQIRADRVGAYDQTPAEFRAELEALWKRGYVPITVGQLLDGKLDLPKGTSPVVMTFDDATKEQLALDGSGRPAANTAVGIMVEFARRHPGFVPRGTFYVNREPFAVQDGAPLLRWLDEHGFELGNHTKDHIPLRTLDDEDVQRQLVLGAAVIQSALPGYRIRSLALPLGSLPEREELAVRGTWDSRSYGPYAVLLVGANPSASPFSSEFDAAAIPRIRSSHLPFGRVDEMGFSYWLKDLDENPSSRYVSDGDASAITAPDSSRSQLAQRYTSRFVAR